MGVAGQKDVVHKPVDAQNLWQAMFDAYTALEAAHHSYVNAAAGIADEERGQVASMKILRKQGREYAALASRYSEAVMAWLAFADSCSEEATKFIAKTKAGVVKLPQMVLSWTDEVA